MKKFLKGIFTAFLTLTLCTSFTACQNNEKTIGCEADRYQGQTGFSPLSLDH